MNARNSEKGLVAQYRGLIKAAVLENESEVMNSGKLNSKLRVIYKAASYDGLDESVIGELIDELVPTKPITKAA